MAGIGVKLNKIFQKNTITSDIIGFGYSTVVTIAPMLVVIADILLMRYFLGFSDVLYSTRIDVYKRQVFGHYNCCSISVSKEKNCIVQSYYEAPNMLYGR